MRHTFIYVLVLSLLATLTGCSSIDLNEAAEGEAQTLTYTVTNFLQQRLDAPTRAEVSVDSLDHLALVVYTKSGEQVKQIIQNRGDKGYGTFAVSLEYADYDFVFLGYNGQNAINTSDAEHISFAGDYVPDTFLKCISITWNAATPRTQKVSLARKVGQFAIKCADAVPKGIDSIYFEITGAGTQLNGKTGYASNQQRNIRVKMDAGPATGRMIYFMLYLPTNPCTIQLKTRVTDTKHNVLYTHTFTDVPMQFGYQTIYEGLFFTNDALSTSLTLDNYDWATDHHTF